jgi:hypothetical protein
MGPDSAHKVLFFSNLWCLGDVVDCGQLETQIE